MAESWRARADHVLTDLFAGFTSETTDTEVKVAVFDAYPFGIRKYTPYKIWLTQVKRHKAARAIGLRGPLTPGRNPSTTTDPNQLRAL